MNDGGAGGCSARAGARVCGQNEYDFYVQFHLVICSLLPAAEADDGRGQHEAEPEAAGGGRGGAQHQHLLHPAPRHHTEGGRKY